MSSNKAWIMKTIKTKLVVLLVVVAVVFITKRIQMPSPHRRKAKISSNSCLWGIMRKETKMPPLLKRANNFKCLMIRRRRGIFKMMRKPKSSIWISPMSPSKVLNRLAWPFFKPITTSKSSVARPPTMQRTLANQLYKSHSQSRYDLTLVAEVKAKMVLSP